MGSCWTCSIDTDNKNIYKSIPAIYVSLLLILAPLKSALLFRSAMIYRILIDGFIALSD